MSGPTLSGQPRTVWPFRASLVAANVTAAGLYLFGDGGSAVISTAASSSHAQRLLNVETAEWEVYDKELQFAIEFRWLTAGTSPAVDVYVSLWRVTGIAGVGANPTVTLGTEVTGARTATFALNAAGISSALQSSGLFEIDATGWYALTAQVSAAMAANTTAILAGRLLCRGS